LERGKQLGKVAGKKAYGSLANIQHLVLRTEGLPELKQSRHLIQEIMTWFPTIPKLLS
jgi:hypothetical protein